jgi:hypothetical protein
VYQGPPERAARGHTAAALGEFLAQRGIVPLARA